MKSLITFNNVFGNAFLESNSRYSKISQIHQTRRLEFYINSSLKALRTIVINSLNRKIKIVLKKNKESQIA